MDRLTRGALVVIAVALCAIAARLWMPGYATLGELQAVVQIHDEARKKQALQGWYERLPMVRVQGGTVDVDLSAPTIKVYVR
jgi:hypothetical protein